MRVLYLLLAVLMSVGISVEVVSPATAQSMAISVDIQVDGIVSFGVPSYVRVLVTNVSMSSMAVVVDQLVEYTSDYRERLLLWGNEMSGQDHTFVLPPGGQGVYSVPFYCVMLSHPEDASVNVLARTRFGATGSDPSTWALVWFRKTAPVHVNEFSYWP